MTDIVDIRRYRSTDAPIVAAFLRTVERFDAAIDGPEDDAFDEFSNLDINRSGRDFRLLFCEDTLVAVLFSARYDVEDRPVPLRGFRIIVDPRYRGRGFARQLYDEVRTQDEQPEVILRTMVTGESGFVHSLLERTGFQCVQSVLHMRHEGAPPELPRISGGFTIRLADGASDVGVVTRLQNEANQRSFGFVPMNQQDFIPFLKVSEGRLFLLENSSGQLVGSVHTLPFYEGVGLLHGVSVKPEYQGRGLGRYLTTYGMDSLARQGFRRIDLTVDEKNRVAVGLYRSLDFLQYRRDLTYER